MNNDKSNKKDQQTKKYLSLKHQIIKLLAEYSSLDEISDTILGTICKFINFAEGEVWKVDPINQVLRCAAVWTSKTSNQELQTFLIITQNITFTKGVGMPGRVWADKKVHWSPDVACDPNFPRAKFAEIANLHGGFGLPIIFKKEVLGVLCFFSNKKAEFNKELINFLQDLSKQLGSFIEREQVQLALKKVARQAGRAEITASILHNVGNLLSPITSAISILKEKVDRLNFENLDQVASLLNENKKRLGPFFSEDEKGKHIIDYLALYAKQNEIKKEDLISEINSLSRNFSLLSTFIKNQLSNEKAPKISESTNVSEVLGTVLGIYDDKVQDFKIKTFSKNEVMTHVNIDKFKLEEILAHLVLNAIESLEKTNQSDKFIKVTATKEHEMLTITVCDNGIGISSDNLNHIFDFGFTTKGIRSGLGLQASLIAARELGGTLEALSDGSNKGATFILKVPLL